MIGVGVVKKIEQKIFSIGFCGEKGQHN